MESSNGKTERGVSKIPGGQGCRCKPVISQSPLWLRPDIGNTMSARELETLGFLGLEHGLD